MSRFFLAAGSLAAALAVMAGAFGAHALESRLSPERLQTFETAVRYHIYHALALLFVSWAARVWPGFLVHGAGYLFVAGLLLFSGSLYLLVLTDTPWLGAVTPVGGLCFIIGWLMLFATALQGS